MENRVDKEKLFRVCDCYGLDEDRALYYTNVIVVPGYNNLHLVLDNDCNVINVCEYENREGNKYNYFEGVCDIFNDDIISDLKLDPNGNLDSAISLGTIFKITDKYAKYYGGELDSSFGEDQKNFVSYFTLLRHLMGRYLLNYYQMKSYGYIKIDLEEYMRRIIDGINNYVARCLKDKNIPDASIFCNVTGQGRAFFGEAYHLKNTMKLLTKCNGYKPTENGSVVPIDEDYTSLVDLIIQMKSNVNNDSLVNEPIQKKKIRKEK